MAYEIKRGDLLPTLKSYVQQPPGTGINLSTAVGVTAVFKRPDATTLRAACNIVDAATGLVQYVWTLGQTDQVGIWQIEFEINWPGTKPQTVPSKGFGTFEIYPDLG